MRSSRSGRRLPCRRAGRRRHLRWCARPAAATRRRLLRRLHPRSRRQSHRSGDVSQDRRVTAMQATGRAAMRVHVLSLAADARSRSVDRCLRPGRAPDRRGRQSLALRRAALYRAGEGLLPRRRHRRAARDERNLERHGGPARDQPAAGHRRRALGRLLQFAEQGPPDRPADVARDQSLFPLPDDPSRAEGHSCEQPADLKGRTVAVAARGAILVYELAKILEAGRPDARRRRVEIHSVRPDGRPRSPPARSTPR